MKLEIQPNQMRGRVVKITASKNGIALPSSNPQKKESVLFIIDEMGSGITNPLCRVGQIIVPMAINNMVLRDKTIHYITEDLVVMGLDPTKESGGDDISIEQLEIDGLPFQEAQRKFHARTANNNGSSQQVSAT